MPPDLSKLTIEQLIAIASGKPTPAGPDAMDASLMQPEPVSPMVRIGQGMSDIYSGAAQKYLNWTNPEAAKEHTMAGNENDAIVARGRAAYGDKGVSVPFLGEIDPLRVAGAMATPLSAIPGGATTWLGRFGLGALAGGAAGYTNFSRENTPTGNAINAGVGALAGGTLNAVTPPLVNAGVRGVQAVGNKIGETGRKLVQSLTSNTQIQNNIKVVLQQGGIDWEKLPAAVQSSVMDDAAKQLQATGKLDPAALIRKADIEAVAGPGMGTRGQITRDPTQWTLEQNLQKTEANIPAVQRGDQVETLTGRFQTQNNAMNTFADSLTGAPRRTQTPLQASAATIKAIQSKDAAAEKIVGELYTKFRDLGKGDLPIQDTRIAEVAGKIADEIGIENVPPAVLNRLKTFGFFEGQRTKLLTVNEADKLNRLINNNNPGHGPQALVSKQLKRAVNEALLEISDNDIPQALIAARNAHAARMRAQEAGLGVSRAIADVAPDKFFEQNILGGNVRDIVAMKKQLLSTTDGTRAFNALREQVVSFLKDKATHGGQKAFNGLQWNDALDKIGVDKMRVLFNPQELQQIETLRRASIAMTTEPPFAAPNRSNTTPSALGAALRLGNRIPGLNMITAPIEREVAGSAQQKMLSKALSSTGAETAGRDASQAAMRKQLVDALVTNRAYNPAVLPSAVVQQKR